MSSRASQASGSSRRGLRQPTAPAVQYPAGYVPRRRGAPLQAEDTLTDTEEDTATEGEATEPLLDPASSTAQPLATAVPTSGQGLLSSAGRGRQLAAGARALAARSKRPAPTLSKAAQQSACFLEWFPSSNFSSEHAVIRGMHERIMRRIPSPLMRDRSSIIPKHATASHCSEVDNTAWPMPPFATITEQWLRDHFTTNEERPAGPEINEIYFGLFEMTSRKLLCSAATRLIAWCDKQRKAEEEEKLAKRVKLEAASAHDSEEVTSISELALPSDIGGRFASQDSSVIMPTASGASDNRLAVSHHSGTAGASKKRKASEIENDGANLELQK